MNFTIIYQNKCTHLNDDFESHGFYFYILLIGKTRGIVSNIFGDENAVPCNYSLQFLAVALDILK